MAPINMRRYETSTHEIPPIPYTQPSGRTLQQHAASRSRHRPITPRPVIPSHSETFPILPAQLEKHLEQAKQHLTHNLSTQFAPASGSAPSPNSDQILPLNFPPAEMVPTVYAFHASTFGMPPVVEFLRFLTRYLDEMTPNKRGKALIDLELLRRIKLILNLPRKGVSGAGETTSSGSGSDSAPTTPYGTGESWDTQAFRRWVRNTFVYRPATQAELERAVDFGLLSPPESSLSGPGLPGYPPSTGLTRSMHLVFHQDRPVALRSRIYKIILRAHWITNHAGRDRTWAMVREVCSYIPKCLVYDFVAACPTCRVARSKQYGTYGEVPLGMSAVDVDNFLKLWDELQYGLQVKVCGDGSNAEVGLPPILPISSHGLPPGGWIPRIEPDDPFRPYATQTPIHPIGRLHYHDPNAQTIADPTSDPLLDPVKLPPLHTLFSPALSIPSQAPDSPQTPHFQGQVLQETRQEVPVLGHGCPSWMVISKLIEATSEQVEGVGMLADSPARKNGPSSLEERLALWE